MTRFIAFTAMMGQAVFDGTKTETRRIVKGQGKRVPDLSGCRYIPGLEYYVKEPWQALKKFDHLAPREILYDFSHVRHGCGQWDARNRHARVMAEWMCRSAIRVIDVYAEKLRDITENGAIAEGFGSRHEFYRTFEEIYGASVPMDDWVWVVRFQARKLDGW